MSNKKPVGSLIGTVIFGVITAFFVLMAVAPLGPGDALLPFFAFIYGSLSGVVFLGFFLFWALKKRKYEKEKSHREMMARRRVERWRREQQRKNDL
jgi:predicted membrane protein